MEENKKIPMNDNGHTPPPVPQPATPPPFNGTERNEARPDEEKQKPEETAQGVNDRPQTADEASPEKTEATQGIPEATQVANDSPKAQTEGTQGQTPADSPQPKADAPQAAGGEMPSPAQMEQLMQQADRELKAFDAEPLPNAGLFTRAFSFRGRITRAEFLLSHTLIPLHFLLVAYVGSIASETASFFIGTKAAASLYNRLMLFSGLFVFCWFYTAQGVKRCHDVGWCGWRFYIPFLNIPLLFKKSQPETNRYGLPATLRPHNADEALSVAQIRKRGIWCAVSWLLCSPVYLVLTWRWKIQKPAARYFMLLVSPLLIGVWYTSQVAHHQAVAENTREAQARAFLSKDHLGMKLPVGEVDWCGEERLSGADTYRVNFYKPLSPADFKHMETLAKQRGSGWTAYQHEEDADNEGDYGYYLEDYIGKQPQPTTAPQCFRFSKTLKGGKGKKESHVVLTVIRQNGEARMTLENP